MDPREQIERQMDRLEEAYERGEIDAETLAEEMRLLKEDCREAAAEAAQAEYDRWFD